MVQHLKCEPLPLIKSERNPQLIFENRPALNGDAAGDATPNYHQFVLQLVVCIGVGVTGPTSTGE